MTIRPEDYGGVTDPLAAIANTSTRPGAGAGRAIDPTRPSIPQTAPGPDADRIAELEREIARAVNQVLTPLGLTLLEAHRAELSRLRDEQPKEGDAYAGHTLDGRPFDDTDAPKRCWQKGDNIRLKTMRPFEFFGTVYEQNSHAVTVVYDDNKLATFHADDLIEQEIPSPSPSPPQDVREALKALVEDIQISMERWHDSSAGPATVSAEPGPLPECVSQESWEQALAALAQSDAQPVVREGHGEPCYYCGKPCSSFAGNPSEWPIPLCHKDEPGVMKWHHSGCVMDRLIENQSDAQPVGWQYRDIGGNWAGVTTSEREADAYKRSGYEVRALYTAPHRSDASGLIEAAEFAKEKADKSDPLIAAILDEFADELRTRAADRSAPRSDRGGA